MFALRTATITFFATALWSSAHASDSDAVVVEGRRAQPTDTSAAVTVIEIDEELPASADVGHVVSGTPGAVVRRLGGLGDYSAVSIRGSSFRQVTIALDGIPLNPDGASAINLSELPLRAFSRIEVYRGNAPASMGVAPIGGVVNLVTGEDVPAALSSTFGALGTVRVGALFHRKHRLGGLEADALVSAEVFGTRGDFEYFTDNGTQYTRADDRIRVRQNNAKVQATTHARWRVRGPGWSLSLVDAFLHRDEGLPGHANAPTEHAALQTTRNLLSVNGEGETGSFHVGGRVWSLERAEHYDDSQGEVGIASQDALYRSGNTGLLANLTWAPSPFFAPQLTVEGRRDHFRATNRLTGEREDLRQRYSFTFTAVGDLFFAGDRVRVSPLVRGQVIENAMLGDVPFEGRPIAPRGASRTVSADPRLGVRASVLPWLVVRGNVGSYLRPPDLIELFGDRGGVVGNAELLPERGWQGDVGVRLITPERSPVSGALEAGVFATDVRNRIVYIQNSQRTMVPVNVGKSRGTGLELGWTGDFWDVFDLSGCLTRQWTRQRSDNPTYDGNQLPRVPEWEAQVAGSLHWRERIRAGWNFSFTDGNYWDSTNWFRSAPRAIHGAFLRGVPLPGGPALELEVLNITNQQVEVVDRNPLDPSDSSRMVQALTDFAGYPLPGRTWMISLRWELSSRGEHG